MAARLILVQKIVVRVHAGKRKMGMLFDVEFDWFGTAVWRVRAGIDITENSVIIIYNN